MLSQVDNLPATSAADFFQDRVNDIFFPMSCEPRGKMQSAFDGGILSHPLGNVGFAVVTGSPLDVYRRRSHIGQVSEAAYLVKIQVQGEALVQQYGREAHLLPGDFTVCLSAEPYELHFPSDYSQVVLCVPRHLLEECVHQPTQHLGVRMGSQVGANGLFTQFVTSISAHLNTIDSALGIRLEANVIDLLATTLSHTHQARRREWLDSGVRLEHIQRIKYFIRRHLEDERLRPDWIAAAHQISTRYLHMLFETENNSISRYIQGMRLEACKKALTDGEYAGYSVADIAYQQGFKNASHFNRSFKSKYGCTPARYRKEFDNTKSPGLIGGNSIVAAQRDDDA